MTIQISVTVWTVVCFLALMLILDRLLFRPMLSFMDRRRKKIDDALAARQDAARQHEELVARRAEERAAAEKQAKADAAAALDALAAENEKRLDEKKAENERRLAGQREELSRQAEEISHALDGQTDALVASFLERIASWRVSCAAETGEETAAPHVEPVAASGPNPIE